MKLGPLECVVKPDGDGPVVVLLHGFGAPGTDLVPLGQVMDVPPSVRFVFPAAPLELGWQFGGGRAWWMIDIERMQRAMARGETRDLSREVPQGLAEARAAVVAMLDEVEARFGGPIVLGGFSQGAMLSCDVALRTERPLAGLVLMSGTYLAADEWKPRMPSRAGLPVMQSHGVQDPLLPFALAERLRDDLGAAGLKVDWHGFYGQHEIPKVVLDAVGAFVTKLAGR